MRKNDDYLIFIAFKGHKKEIFSKLGEEIKFIAGCWEIDLYAYLWI